MKGITALQRSYQKQKRIYDEAMQERINNKRRKIAELSNKIETLCNERQKLETSIANEKEFESFESFRQKATNQSSISKS